MKKAFLFFSVIMLLVACDIDYYDTGDGELSYMRADFVMAHTSASTEFDYAVTDEGESLVINPHATASWATTTDSLYRALLYYNIGKDKVTPISISKVLVLQPKNTSMIKEVHTDPVNFESAWLSADGKYINIGMSLMTGQSDELDKLQMVAMMCDSVVINDNGSSDVYLRLFHDQNGVPEYYSSRAFVSVPTSGIAKGSNIHITINTYKGKIEKSFAY